ncbi:HYDIN protein, partial [Malurus elegans]|nr:HYDIN protein [Malurus elegans]
TFEVRFESTRQPLGDVDVLLPITVPHLSGPAAGWAQQQMSPAMSTEFSVLLQVTKGPMSHIHLHATVVPLSLVLSKKNLHFSDTFVGQCQVEVVRLHNWLRVACRWFITVCKPVKKVRHGQH